MKMCYDEVHYFVQLIYTNEKEKRREIVFIYIYTCILFSIHRLVSPNFCSWIFHLRMKRNLIVWRCWFGKLVSNLSLSSSLPCNFDWGINSLGFILSSGEMGVRSECSSYTFFLMETKTSKWFNITKTLTLSTLSCLDLCPLLFNRDR
jgi:hypothetical protein